MNNAKRTNALLWTGNILLIIGIVAFAFQFLIFPEVRAPEAEPPISVPPFVNPQDPTDTQALARVPNPLLPPKDIPKPGSVASGPIRLIGTDRIQDDPTADTAYLFIVNRSVNVNAYVGEPIRDESAGQEVSELNGWRLKSVTPKTALFDTPAGPTTLQLEEITASAPSAAGPPGSAALAGTAWDSARYTSKKNPQRSNDSQEAWDIDRKEVEWAAANADALMQGVQLDPYAGGGLKITVLPEGSYGADRGLRSGDVIRSVNGQQIESIGKLTEVMRNMSRNTPMLTVQVDRSGRIYTLQYTAPRAPR
jgi:hypothetical protein